MEVWKPVIGYEGLYEVSNLGRIKRLSKNLYQICGGTPCKRILKKKILKNCFVTHGYIGIGLSKDKKRKSFTIHRLVAIAFIQNPDNKPQINHKNFNKSDNRVENIEWVSAQENVNHAVKNGKMTGAINQPRGEKIGISKLTWKKVREIRRKYKPGRSKCSQDGYSMDKIAKEYGVAYNTINCILNMRTWIYE